MLTSFVICWTTWWISMKFSEKMWLMIIIKVAKKQGFTVSLESTFFKKQHGDGWSNLGIRRLETFTNVVVYILQHA